MTDSSPKSNGFRDARGRFCRGNPGGPGRPKGSRDRVGELANAVLNAFQRLGGVDWLVAQAEQSPRDFIALLGRLLNRVELAAAPQDAAEQVRMGIEVVLPARPDEQDGGSELGE